MMPWLLPLIYFALDALFGRIGGWNSVQWLWYGLSLVASFALWYVWWRTVRALRPHAPRLAVAAAILGGCLYGFNTVLVYGYVAFVGAMPNFFTFEYLIDEPLNSWMLLRDTLTALHLVLFVPLSALFAWWLYGSSRRGAAPVGRFRARYALTFVGLLFVVVQLVLHNNARFVDQCFAADMTTTTSLARNISTRLRDQITGKTGLLARIPRPLPDISGHALKTADGEPINLLVILTESVRADGFGVYGNVRPATPFFDALAVSDSSSVFLYQNAFSNSSRTYLSMPSLLTGIAPIQSARLLHSEPTLWEYFRAVGYQTFMITSQSHDWRQLKVFLKVAGIDYLFNKETSGLAFENDMGILDRHTLEAFGTWLGTRDATRGFAGVFQPHCTHYPYWAPDSLKLFGEDEERDRYDNAMRSLDDILRGVYAALTEHGLDGNTIVVLTSDHGEEFKEHGYFGHGTYYRETLWIPMLWSVPDPVRRALREPSLVATLADNATRNVSNLDVVPTLLDFFDLLDTDALAETRKSLLGQSLLRPVDPFRPIIACNNSEVNRVPMGVTLVTGRYHYILNLTELSEKREEIYDWNDDIREQTNVRSAADPLLLRRIYTEFARYPICVALFRTAGIDLNNAPHASASP